MTASADLVVSTPSGLFCPRGGFHVDPWAPVERALITHVHADHAVAGSESYLCAAPSMPFAWRRLGPEAVIHGLPYGESVRLGEVQVSLHPAGHVLGSAQARIESSDGVWVVSGDYKRAPDPTCAAFEVLPCDVFITEATFGLPIFRWEEPATVVAAILEWWQANARAGRASVLFCYAMGKAPRILAELAGRADRSVLTHGAVEALLALYREAGVVLAATAPVAESARGRSFAGELVLAPPSALGSPWLRRFGAHETALASGHMLLRGTRRRRALDRGFALSDHADWPALLRTVAETGARRVLVTHGHAEELARYLRERGLAAEAVRTAWADQADL